MKKNKVFALVLICACHLVNAQTFNVRLQFSNGYAQGGTSCFEASDNSFHFFCGYYDTLGFGRVGVITTDLFGQPVDEFILASDSSNVFLGYFGSVDKFSNGYVAPGNYGFPPYDQVKGQIMMFNLAGDTVWTKVYEPDLGNDIYFRKAIKVEDGILICGSLVINSESEVAVLLKFDNEGNFLWQQEYSASQTLALVSIVELPTNQYLLGGARIQTDNWDQMIIKVDSSGGQIWRKFFGGSFSNYFAIVCNALDGKYIFGSNDSNGDNDEASDLNKLNFGGAILWEHDYGDIGPNCHVNAIKQMPDGGFVFCGIDGSTWLNFGYICRIDADGNHLWYRKYQQTEDNECYFTDVVSTSDGGFLLTGDLYPDPGLTQDMWALKLDSMGCLIPGCNVGIIEQGQQANFSIYPNPADDFINVFVESKTLHNCELTLLDMWGRVIYSERISESGSTYMMDSAVLSDGLYLLQLSLEGEVVRSEKVVVRHE